MWLVITLVALQATGSLAGPWWALGLLAGPAGAEGALQRAKPSTASIGTISTYASAAIRVVSVWSRECGRC
nr:hypothetical protein [Salinispora cortesiana]